MDHFTNLNVPCNTNAEKSWDDSAPVSLPGTSDKNAETPTFDLQRAILKERNGENLSIEELDGGTIIVSVKCKSGIICVSDSRSTNQGVVTSDDRCKIKNLSDNTYIMYSGPHNQCADLRQKLLELSDSNRRPFTTSEFASVAFEMIAAERWRSNVIICGVDGEKMYLYKMGRKGAIDAGYATMTGSGVPSIKKEESLKFTEDMSYREAKRLALRAVRLACEREPETCGGKPYLLFLGVEPNLKFGPIFVED